MDSGGVEGEEERAPIPTRATPSLLVSWAWQRFRGPHYQASCSDISGPGFPEPCDYRARVRGAQVISAPRPAAIAPPNCTRRLPHPGTQQAADVLPATEEAFGGVSILQQVKPASSRRQWRAEQGQEVRISIQRGPSTRALGGLLKEALGDTRAPSGGGDCGENEGGGRWVGDLRAGDCGDDWAS